MTTLNDLEIVRNIMRQLIRKRKEIETMKSGEEKNKALKAYAEFLTSLETNTLNSLTPRQARAYSGSEY